MKKDQELQEDISQIALELINVINTEHANLQIEISRMSNIVNEASRKLHESFHGFQDEKQQLLDALASSQPGSDPLRPEKDEPNHMHKGITSLQFEDIVQQMLAHANVRLQTIENLMGELNQKISDYMKDPSDNALAQMLSSCRNEIEAARQKLILDNPVKQDSLDKGDVTFF